MSRRLKGWAAALAAGLAAAVSILVAGGADHPVILLLALISAVSFVDLTWRAYSEPIGDGGDATDWLMSVAFLSILVGAAYDASRQWDVAALSRRALFVRGIGLAVIVLGVLLRALAARALGASFSVRLKTRPDQALVDWGPYRYVRHPTYTALLAVALGTATGLESALALGATGLVWLPAVLLRISREERLMMRRFGDSYRSYAERTWRLVPGIF